MTVVSAHPCLRCGACCAAFRVALHWSEAQPANPDGPPAALTEPLRRHELALRVDASRGHPRCLALRGDIGRQVQCAIYPQRPSPCRQLQASYEHGERSEQCDRARARHGLPPLTPADFRPA